MVAEKKLGAISGFDDFIRNWLIKQNTNQWIHLVPQYQFVCSAGTKIDVDYVGRLENIEESFEYLRNHIYNSDHTAEMKWMNKSARQRDYRQYYTPALRDMVGEIYHVDVKLFGYEF